MALSLETRREHAQAIARRLAQLYPDAHAELDFTSPLELLIATVLSAQTTDVRVNQVTPTLFARYPDAAAYAGADRDELEEILRPIGFFRVKAGHLIGIGTRLVQAYDGEVPASLDELVTLPGVGRKTANVVLGNAFGIPGITPDTHVIRLSNRFGWVKTKNPDQVERALSELFPPDMWVDLSHRLIWHGRRQCFARNPRCGDCIVAELCPAFVAEDAAQ